MINIYNELIIDINKSFKYCIKNIFYFNKIERRLFIVEQYKYIVIFLNRRNLITFNQYKYLTEKLNDFLGYNK